jgi:hypothetical protein
MPGLAHCAWCRIRVQGVEQERGRPGDGSISRASAGGTVGAGNAVRAAAGGNTYKCTGQHVAH